MSYFHSARGSLFVFVFVFVFVVVFVSWPHHPCFPLQEDHYVSTDFLHVLDLMKKEKARLKQKVICFSRNGLSYPVFQNCMWNMWPKWYAFEKLFIICWHSKLYVKYVAQVICFSRNGLSDADFQNCIWYMWPRWYMLLRYVLSRNGLLYADFQNCMWYMWSRWT